jgi:hypothetical protein
MYLNRMYCAEENAQKGFYMKWILSLRHLIRQPNKQETRKHTLEMRTVQAKQQTGREERGGEVG